MKKEFGKKLLNRDYLVLGGLILVHVLLSLRGADTTTTGNIIIAWIAQIAISSGCYYWKAKAENLVKLPIFLLRDLPEDMKDKADPNQIIASVLGIGTHNNNT